MCGGPIEERVDREQFAPDQPEFFLDVCGDASGNANPATPTAYSQANNPTLNLTGHDYITIRGLTIQGSIRAFNEKSTRLAALTVLNAIEASGGSHAGGIDDKQDSIRNVHRYNDFKGVQNCLRFQNQRALGNATGTLAYGNLCRLGSASGIRYAVEFEDGGLTDLTIYNNTFAGGWNWRMHFTTEGNPVRGLAVYNNAFRGMTGLNVDTEGGSNVSTNAWTLLDYDFYGKRDYRLRSSTHSSRPAMSRAEGFERHGCEVARDAACKSWGFTNEAGDNYTLLASSPLKNAGRTGGTSDGMPVDIGAFGVTSCVGHLCSGSGW